MSTRFFFTVVIHALVLCRSNGQSSNGFFGQGARNQLMAAVMKYEDGSDLAAGTGVVQSFDQYGRPISGFSGWLLPSDTCQLVETLQLAQANSIVVVASARAILSCGRAELSRTAAEIGLVGIIELKSDDEGPMEELQLSIATHAPSAPMWLTVTSPNADDMLAELTAHWIWMSAGTSTHPTQPVDDNDNDQDPYNRKNEDTEENQTTEMGLVMYIAIGTACGAITGVVILIFIRLCTNRHIVIPREVLYYDSISPEQVARKKAVREILSTIPVGPYERVASRRRLFVTDLSGENVDVVSNTSGDVDVESDDDEIHPQAVPCAICLDDMRGSNTCRPLPCGHVFHAGCIDPWLIEQNTCPLCIQNIVAVPGSTSTTEATPERNNALAFEI